MLTCVLCESSGSLPSKQAHKHSWSHPSFSVPCRDSVLRPFGGGGELPSGDWTCWCLDSHFLFAELWESISVHYNHQPGIVGSRDTSGLGQVCMKSKENAHTRLGRYEKITQLTVTVPYAAVVQHWSNLNKDVKFSPVQTTGSFSYCCDKTLDKEAFILVYSARVQSITDRKSRRQKHETAGHISATVRKQRNGCW